MEQAYSVKEREVEQELGHLRDQFTRELKNIAARKTEGGQEGLEGGQELRDIQDPDLHTYYLRTSKEIKQLLI